MPLNIKERKAHIVVNTVYRIGKNILLVASKIDSLIEKSLNSFFICKNLTVT